MTKRRLAYIITELKTLNGMTITALAQHGADTRQLGSLTNAYLKELLELIPEDEVDLEKGENHDD